VSELVLWWCHVPNGENWTDGERCVLIICGFGLKVEYILTDQKISRKKKELESKEKVKVWFWLTFF
jgi:hypothetical protein